MHPAARIALGCLAFYAAFALFTMGTTVGHEYSHALSWDSEAPRVIFASDSNGVEERFSEQRVLTIDGQPYRVNVVERTTIVLYPKSILFTGMTLGLAPASAYPSPDLGATYFPLDKADYTALARGEDVVKHKHAAAPMYLNALLTFPVWAWAVWRPSGVAAAAGWANVTEWRFNAHHAEAVGIHPGLYMVLSGLLMAAAMAVLAARLAHRQGWFAKPTPNAEPA